MRVYNQPMRLRALLRILRAMLITAVAGVLCAFALVQFQQRLLRHRAERLLADFQSIRLNQSNWADAQVLMKRWGAWGHYDGTCTAAYSGDTFFRVYASLGGRYARMRVTFLVQDGLIHRSGMGLGVSVTSKEAKDEFGYGLTLSARASDHLRVVSRHEPWILGEDDQLAQHPEYKVGRPSGCEICMSGEVTFTPYLPLDQLRRLTAYDLGCFTRWHHPCLLLQDLLPVAKDWHLYPSMETPSQPEIRPVSSTSCNIPIMALARDAVSIAVVDSLADTRVPDDVGPGVPERTHQAAEVRLIQTLKRSLPVDAKEPFTVVPSNGDYADALYTSEDLVRGKRYVLFVRPQVPDSSIVIRPTLRLIQCSVVEDSPEVRMKIRDGLARLDPLRRADTFANPLW
jgi:hypothetical protein